MVHVPIHGNSTRPDGTSAVGPIVAIAAASAAGSFRAAGSRAILFSPVWLLDGCCTGNRTTDLVDRQPLFGLYQGSPQWAYLGVAHRFLVQNTRRSIYSDEVCCWSLCRKVSLANIDERLKSSLTSSMYESCLVRSLPGHSPLYYVAWQGPPCPKTPLEGWKRTARSMMVSNLAQAKVPQCSPIVPSLIRRALSSSLSGMKSTILGLCLFHNSMIGQRSYLSVDHHESRAMKRLSS